jgi:hypothetical protein
MSVAQDPNHFLCVHYTQQCHTCEMHGVQSGRQTVLSLIAALCTALLSTCSRPLEADSLVSNTFGGTQYYYTVMTFVSGLVCSGIILHVLHTGVPSFDTQ